MKSDRRNFENKGRSAKGNDKNKAGEKTFDKKKYRLQKYSNKYKVNQWEERNKKAALREFYKDLKKENFNQRPLNSEGTSKNEVTDEVTSKRKDYAFYKAKQEYQYRLNEKKKRIEKAAQVKAEREEALKKYKEKKTRNSKILSMKTKKGQPLMKGRIELLLEKIQQSVT
ncbi:hypothetical protein HN011_000247 [Eciton burchellii]|nr:hypothetical protein HN011_000247 [Eciton burchellii]